MCAKTGTVLIGGTAGQSIIFILSETAGDHLVPTKTIDLLEKQDDKVKWKGMDLKSFCSIKMTARFKGSKMDRLNWTVKSGSKVDTS